MANPIVMALLLKPDNNFNENYFGGVGSISKNDDNPICLNCNTQMIHLCRINTNKKPYKNILYPNKITSIFICFSDKCRKTQKSLGTDFIINESQPGIRDKYVEPLNNQIILPQYKISDFKMCHLSQVGDSTYIQIQNRIVQIHMNVMFWNMKYICDENKFFQLKTIILQNTKIGIDPIGFISIPLESFEIEEEQNEWIVVTKKKKKN